MKYKLTDKTKIILEHIVFVAEKSAKQVQFCFMKGKKQYYINPSKDILVSFELDRPITFDYPIKDLKTFLGEAVVELDSNNISITKDELVLPTKIEIKLFEDKKIIQSTKFTQKDLLQLIRNKFRYMNVIGENKEFIIRYQDHLNDWWFDDGNKKIFTLGVANRKFRYVIKRDRIKLLPNDYKLVCKEGGILNFQYKHLNYYFKPENFWQRQQVKSWVTIKDKIKDKDLIALYKSKGYL
jgi:hypothetical protein